MQHLLARGTRRADNRESFIAGLEKKKTLLSSLSSTDVKGAQ